MIEFSINTKKQFWHCRQCDTGGDVIALVRHLDGVNFPTALTTLTGEPAPKTNSHAQVHNTAVGREGIAARFDYNDESGNLLFQVRRNEYEMLDGSFILNKDGKHKKTFRQKRPDPAKPGAWIQNVDGVRTIPYKLPELIEAIGLGHEVIIVEGEGKVDLLRTWNIPRPVARKGRTNGNQRTANSCAAPMCSFCRTMMLQAANMPMLLAPRCRALHCRCASSSCPDCRPRVTSSIGLTMAARSSSFMI